MLRELLGFSPVLTLYFSAAPFQLREYIDDTEDYINIQVTFSDVCACWYVLTIQFLIFFVSLSSFGVQLDNHRNQLIQVNLQ